MDGRGEGRNTVHAGHTAAVEVLDIWEHFTVLTHTQCRHFHPHPPSPPSTDWYIHSHRTMTLTVEPSLGVTMNNLVYYMHASYRM